MASPAARDTPSRRAAGTRRLQQFFLRRSTAVVGEQCTGCGLSRRSPRTAARNRDKGRVADARSC